MQINVTKPFLPPIDEFQRYVQAIWTRGWVTNHGPLVNELELRLKEHLGIDHLLFVANGTLALQIAIRALELKGEIITTAFSHVATVASIAWEGCAPVVVDVQPDTLTIDPARIEAAITDRTSAILAVHVYGNACAIDDIARIAERHRLTVIYDAAHAFGSTFAGRALVGLGDVSAISFHATKIFHTVEGGAVVARDPETLRRMALLRNFGHTSPNTFDGLGINGKNTELHAAMGLCNLAHIDEIMDGRRRVAERYDRMLARLPLTRPAVTPGCQPNHAYYPVIFESEPALLDAVALLEQYHVHPRRYFFPALSELPYVKAPNATPVASDVSSRVLCLPIYHTLSNEEVDMISRLVHRALKY